ncbi:MAG: hypothetical protein NVS2B17_22120 [Candidatus Velthaea sp.]
MRRVIAPLGICGLVLAFAIGAQAQVNAPVTPPRGPINPPGVPTGAPLPAITPTPAPSGSPDTPASPAPSPASATPAPVMTVPPTPVPIVVEPPAPAVEPGKVVQARVSGVLGTIVATSADPAVADVIADQNQRAIFITGRKVGTTVITVKDDRGMTRDVPVRVAYAAGVVADETSLRITGNPASNFFLREAVANAAQRAATLRPGAALKIYPDALNVRGKLGIDSLTSIDVPVQIVGDSYLPANGVTRVHVENFALPKIQPSMLLVSDYPETLRSGGVLFTADLGRREAQRFLYYHYNPANQPNRRILLKVQNPSNEPATVQFISGSAGPGPNEMEVGHLSTQRFLVREYANEGTVVTIPPNATVNLVDHALPAGSIVSALLQLREVEGSPLHLTLVAQDATAPLDQPVDTTQLLAGDVKHARGIYQVPEFFFDYSYPVDGENLEIPIGQLPLPNLRQGEALSGDYGVKQTVTVRIVNSTARAAQVAIYANPRGGRATGTFLIDQTLVQAHALASFSKYKIWQQIVPAHTYQSVKVTTMPEGGSSYPLRLILAPDDGSVPLGAPGSPIY